MEAVIKKGSGKPRVDLYDSTLRDGAQSRGIDFSIADKLAIAQELDRLGIDYIEGGWPGANPTDDAFFSDPPALSRSKIVAFGMTRRPGNTVENDPGLGAILTSGAAAACLVGKTWDFHVEVALGTSLDENLAMIAESIAAASGVFSEVLFDAEHFFDGYAANPDYALRCLETAYHSGARWVVLCDTNGGSLPHDVEKAVEGAIQVVPGEHLGVHMHNDTDTATANSLAAVRAGARQIQGTFNGLGERCGNANLVSIVPSLVLKMGFETSIDAAALANLTAVSRGLDERLNRAPDHRAPYVGESAFSHKGGLHVSAIAKDPRSYEHIVPGLVGNARNIVVSNQAGRANIVSRLAALDMTGNDQQINDLIEKIKSLEFEGYAYDGAEASFEVLARRHLEGLERFYRLISFRVTDERRWNAKGVLVTISEATIKVEVGDQSFMHVAEGNGPVNALDRALRQALTPAYPSLATMELTDYKVRILTPNDGTRAVTRVMIESCHAGDSGQRWTTVGVSPNVIDASYSALDDSITYKLLKDGHDPSA